MKKYLENDCKCTSTFDARTNCRAPLGGTFKPENYLEVGRDKKGGKKNKRK